MDQGRTSRRSLLKSPGVALLASLMLCVVAVPGGMHLVDSASADDVAKQAPEDAPDSEEDSPPDLVGAVRELEVLLRQCRHDEALALAKAARKRYPESHRAAVMYYKAKLALQDAASRVAALTAFEARLDRGVTVHRAAPLSEMLSILGEAAGIPISFEDKDLEAVHGSRPIAFNVNAMPLHVALEQLLAPFDLVHAEGVTEVETHPGPQGSQEFVGITTRAKRTAGERSCAGCHQNEDREPQSYWLSDFAAGNAFAGAVRRPLLVLLDEEGGAPDAPLMRDVFDHGGSGATVHPLAVTVRLRGQGPERLALCRKYGIDSFPTVLAFAGDDRILLRWDGYSRADRSKRLAELRHLPGRFAKESAAAERANGEGRTP